MVSIIKGKFRKKKIEVPKKEVRPTSAKKREAIFSILESFAIKNAINLYNEKCFIDLFAGSGSLGLEAISRGADFTYFYENNNDVYKILKKNCNIICKNYEFKIFKQNILNIKKINIKFPCSVIFIDPPYKFYSFDIVFKTIINSKILNINTIIVLETSAQYTPKIPDNLKLINEKKYGITKILFLKN
tara:strand:- start:574 stop:1137 length:564 start_codon:yes stop_codon:yes gene_type:complete